MSPFSDSRGNNSPMVDASPSPHLPCPLAGMRAVVTGASGGIGRQAAVSLAIAGVSRIGLHFSADAAAARATAELVEAAGCQTVLLQADFADPAQCNRMVEEAFAEVAPSIWVHAAGADVLTGEAAEQSFHEKLRRLVEVDFIGTLTVARLVAERLARAVQAAAPGDSHSPASIVLIGWDQASEGMEGDAGQLFGPVKAAVAALGKSLAQQHAPWVRVNTLEPGWIRTAWGESTHGYWDQRARGQALMARWGTPDDIAAAAVFLASPTSGFITGQTLAVNGGFSRHWARP